MASGLPKITDNLASQNSPPERPLPLDVLPDAPDLVVEVGEDSYAGVALVGATALGSLVSHPGVLVLGRGDEIIVQGVQSTRGPGLG